METNIEKNSHGQWEAKTSVNLPPVNGENLVLQIVTCKRLSGLLTSTAQVVIQEESGMVLHRFPDDFNHHLLSVFTRCTEKAVREQHESVLAHIDELIAKATAHYKQDVEVEGESE